MAHAKKKSVSKKKAAKKPALKVWGGKKKLLGLPVPIPPIDEKKSGGSKK